MTNPRASMPSLVEHADAQGVALFAMTNPLPQDGSAPEWVTVFPNVGQITTRDKRSFDVSAATLMAAFKEDGISIPVDVNHSTDMANLFGGPAPAVGWGTELREHAGGLQIKVDWLTEGKALLKARQYLYTSPSFYHEEGRPTRLKALALVTSPALARQSALARSGGGPAQGAIKAVALALGLGEGAAEADCLSAIQSLRAGGVPKAEHEAVVARLAALETATSKAAIDTMLDDAMRALKVTPAERPGYAALCATPAGFAQVKELISKKTRIIPQLGLDGKTPPGTEFEGETPDRLAGRATHYREQQARVGVSISQIDAIRFVSENPTAGR